MANADGIRLFPTQRSSFASPLNVCNGLPLRQSLGLVQSLLTLAQLDWPVPDYSTVSRRQQRLQVQLPYQPRRSALHLLVDSTGIKFLGEGECQAQETWGRISSAVAQSASGH